MQRKWIPLIVPESTSGFRSSRYRFSEKRTPNVKDAYRTSVAQIDGEIDIFF